MRETSSLGIAVSTIALIAFVQLPHVATAMTPGQPQAGSAPRSETAELAEPATDLPTTPAPSLDFITLFPNPGEAPSSKGLNDQRFGFLLHGEARAVYESNLFIDARHEQSDFGFRVSPGMAIGWGEFKREFYETKFFPLRRKAFSGNDFFYLDYAPSYSWFLDHGELDTFDHAIGLESEWTFQRVALATHATYETEDIPVDEIGDRVRQKHLDARVTARFPLGQRWSLDTTAAYEGFDGDGVDLREGRTEDWLDYQITPQFKVGLGGTFGWVDRDVADGQSYEQARLRVVYQASPELSLAVSGGSEWRHADDGEDGVEGVFHCELSWNPSEEATWSLLGYRQLQPGRSWRNDWNVATGVCVQYRQRIFQRCYVACAAGYQNSAYRPAARVDGAREDDLFFVRPGVGVDLSAWLNCEIAGEYRHNDSNEQFGYDATKATLRFNVVF